VFFFPNAICGGLNIDRNRRSNKITFSAKIRITQLYYSDGVVLIRFSFNIAENFIHVLELPVPLSSMTGCLSEESDIIKVLHTVSDWCMV